MPISVSLFAIRFLFVRHGESVSNAVELFSGQMDMELTEQGKRDAEESVRWLAEEEIGSIYSSSLKRVWQTAEPIVTAKGGVEIHPVEGIIERSYGEWEGQSTRDYDRGTKPPSGESPEEFNRRTIEALKVLSGVPPILIVVHSGTCRALRGHLCGIDTTYDSLKNGRPVAFTPLESGDGLMDRQIGRRAE